jgi:hypothetical protein
VVSIFKSTVLNMICRNIDGGMERMDAIDAIDAIDAMTKKRLHTRAGIRVQHGNTLLASTVLEEALLGTVVRSAGQTREIDEDGDLLSLSLRGQIEVEFHLAFCGCGGVAQLEQLAAEGGDGCVCSDRHAGRVKGGKGDRKRKSGRLTFLWWGEMVPHEGKGPHRNYEKGQFIPD